MTDYCTLAEFKAFAKIVSLDATDDTVISMLITSASAWIEKFTGRSFTSTSATKYYDVPTSGKDRRIIYIDDCLSLTTVTNGDSTVITSANYQLLPLNTSPKYAIRLKDSSAYDWEPTSTGDTLGAISLAGSWGYSATTPGDIKAACLEIALAAYRRRSTIGSQQMAGVTPAGVIVQPEDVSKQVMYVLRGYMRAF